MDTTIPILQRIAYSYIIPLPWADFCDCIVLAAMCLLSSVTDLTKHFTTLEYQNPSIDEFYFVQKRRSADIEALKL